MATVKMSAQDWKDMDKFIKFLAYKTVQVIVQSRLGEKTRTKSKSYSSGADWFNLAIKDVAEVQAESKKALAGMLATVGLSICVEISLKTIEGDTMVLETWCLGMTEQCDNSVRVTNTVYSRLGLLLKSLISVTRVTPAYKLSCRQGPDSFVICYRVYMGEPQLKCLGENYLHVRVGQVGTPIGTVVLAVAYRTQLTLTPQKMVSDREGTIMVKSDHFKPDMSPYKLQLQHQQPPCGPQAHVNCHLDHGSMVEEIAAACKDGEETNLCLCPGSAPAATTICDIGVENGEHEKKFINSLKEQQVSISTTKKVGAFAGELQRRLEDGEAGNNLIIPKAPFLNLLQQQDNNKAHITALHHKNNKNNNNVIENNETTNNNTSNNSSLCSSVSSSSAVEDFVLVELISQKPPPFVGADCANDLNAFYRECQTAPPLMSFSDQPSLADQVSDLSNQLAAFETKQLEFDEFLDALYNSDSSK